MLQLPSGPFAAPHGVRTAVRPFVVAGGDYLGSHNRFGFAARLTLELRRRPELWLVPFDRMRPFADPRIEDREVGRALGGPYIVAGHVIGYSDGRFLLGVRIVDGLTGERLPAPPELYDHVTSIASLYELQYPRLAAIIASAIIKHRDVVVVHARRRLTPTELVERARSVLAVLEVSAIDAAEEDLRHVICEEPQNADAWALLARAGLLRLGQGRLKGQTRQQLTDAIDEATDRALAANRFQALALICRGHLQSYAKLDPAAGYAWLQRGIAADPFEPLGWSLAAGTLAYRGRTDEALRYLDEAQWLAPLTELSSYHHTLYRGLVHYAAKDWHGALLWTRLSIERNPAFTASYKLLAAAYAALGNIERAREASRELRRRDPVFGITRESFSPFADIAMDRAYRRHLREAGAFDLTI